MHKRPFVCLTSSDILDRAGGQGGQGGLEAAQKATYNLTTARYTKEMVWSSRKTKYSGQQGSAG